MRALSAREGHRYLLNSIAAGNRDRLLRALGRVSVRVWCRDW